MNKWYVASGAAVLVILGLVWYGYTQQTKVKTLNEQLTTQLEINKTINQQYNEQLKINKDVKTVIVTVKEPNGTTTTTSTTEDKSQISNDTETTTKVKETVVDKATQTVTTSESTTVSLSRYSVFVSYPATVDRDPSLLRAGVAVRLGSLPLFLQADSDIHADVRGGLRMDW
jgi:hypothetical protein